MYQTIKEWWCLFMQAWWYGQPPRVGWFVVPQEINMPLDPGVYVTQYFAVDPHWMPHMELSPEYYYYPTRELAQTACDSANTPNVHSP